MTYQLAKKTVIHGWKNSYLASLVENHSLCGMGDVNVRISAVQLMNQTWFIQRRWKKRKREERGPEDDTELEEGPMDVIEDLSHDDDDAMLGKKKDFKDIKVTVSSLRLELILKAGLGISRSKVDQIFYDNRVRLNGEQVLKKGVQIALGDELDVISGFSETNPHFLVVSRVILQAAHRTGSDDKDENVNFKVTLRRFKNLIVENYPDPWGR
ncbi:unnamed protein product [Darwinula stevensoni]|uniref:Mitochondrial transcription rescue factor 1 C-terminal domain-containing protein n=1 Tax=Darwinula stevensoni TaxID=69355 RepID=A0A7R8X3F6_9CRUS|nr:unnamed protein product [Darwinula stevensoni]CAG0878597.1 unnamed protein product [Darwinula stevensoni]